MIRRLLGKARVFLCMLTYIDIDYFITNVKPEKVTEEWLVTTYSQSEFRLYLGLKFV